MVLRWFRVFFLVGGEPKSRNTRIFPDFFCKKKQQNLVHLDYSLGVKPLAFDNECYNCSIYFIIDSYRNIILINSFDYIVVSSQNVLKGFCLLLVLIISSQDICFCSLTSLNLLRRGGYIFDTQILLVTKVLKPTYFISS